MKRMCFKILKIVKLKHNTVCSREEMPKKKVQNKEQHFC